MKTSNKLLIGFAILTLLIPVVVMAVISKVYYTDAKSWADLEKQNETFDGKSENMDAITLSQFNAINIADGKEVDFYIHLVKDKKFGVKVAKRNKDFIKFNVDKDGRLQINLTSTKNTYNYIELYVYAPETNALSAYNVSDLELNVKADSLSLNLKKFLNLKFNEATKLETLSVNSEGGYTNIEENAVVKSLYLNLNSASFRSERISYEDLSITSTGNSEINVFGGNADQQKYSIGKLTLKTTDSANVTFRSVAILDTRGSLSDQTTVQLPVSSLRQLLK
mgnify:CR=1 FL=1